MDEEERGNGEVGEGGGEGVRCYLLSVRDTSSLLAPISTAQRIKYTSVALSPNYIALGANTGGVYCFHRHDYRYIRILSNQEGCVSLLSISPSEHSLALCCAGGLVALWELNLAEQGISKRIHVCPLLKDAMVTDMVWDSKGSKLFFGDDQGRLAVSYMPKKVFKKLDEILLQEKPIVQMDLHQDLLLVSTVTKCVLFNASTHDVLQVSKKQREGSFGACFHMRWQGKPPVVYSARPGRLWEADAEGTVLSTLRLKELITTPATPLLGYGYDLACPSASPSLPLNFPCLRILSQDYLVCGTPASGSLFIMHSPSYQLAGWTEALGPYTAQASGEQLFLLARDGRSLRVLEFVSLSKCLQGLVELGQLQEARQVMESHSEDVNNLLPNDHALFCACKTITATYPPSQQLLDTLNSLRSHEDDDVIEEAREVQHDVTSQDEWKEEGGHQIEKVEEVRVHPPNTPSSEVISSNVDFPLDIVGGTREPDLDSALLSDEIAMTTTSNDTSGDHHDNLISDHTPLVTEDPILENLQSDMDAIVAHANDHEIVARASDHEAVARASDRELVARSLSKVIPSSNHRSLVQVETNEGGNRDHTPNSQGRSSNASSLGNREKLSWQQDDSLEDDIIAVPMIVRSTSSGSLSGKTKSKKKSRRKKSSTPPPSHQQQQLIPPPPQQQQQESSGSLPPPSVSPSSSLLHIPEEDLPFPEVGLPPSLQSSSPPSLSASPFPSLPPTPPPTSLSNSPEKGDHAPDHTPQNPDSNPDSSGKKKRKGSKSSVGRERRRSQDKGGGERGPKPQRSSSIDIFSKVKSMALQGSQTVGQKVVRGFLSSLSNPSSDSGGGAGHVTPQPVVYRNDDLASPVSSVEEGRFAMSPLSNESDGIVMETLPSLNQVHPQTQLFCDVTMETSSSLDDPVCLCCMDQVKGLLHSWLHSLETYLATQYNDGDVESGGVSILSPPPPYSPLPLTLTPIVTHLATLCAELAIYSSGKDIILSDSSCDPPDSSCDQPRPTGLEEFIGQYVDVLDLNRLRCLLNREPWSVRGKLWGALICVGDFLSAGNSLLIDTVGSNSMSDRDILTLLMQSPRIREDFISHALSCFPRLMPWEVALACDVGSDQSEAMKESCDHDLYVIYLSRLLSNKGSSVGEEIVREMFTNDPEFLLASLTVVLEGEGQDHTHTHTAGGKPRPGSHTIQWEESECLASLVDLCVVVGEETCSEARDICMSSGYWIGALRFLVAIGDKKKAFSIIFSLGDMELLTQHQPWGDLLGGVSDWKDILAYLSETPNKGVTMVNDQVTPTLVSDREAVSDSTTEATEYENTLPCGGHTSSQPPPHPKCVDRDVDGGTDKSVDGGVASSLLFKHMLSRLSPGTIYSLLSTTPPSSSSSSTPSSSTPSSSSSSSSSYGHVFSEENPHSLLVAMTALHTQQRVVAHSLLEKVDRYLWSPRPSVIGPHIYSILATEKDGDTMKDSLLPPPPSLPGSSPLLVPPTLEEVGLHWGVRTCSPSQFCSMCRVSLVAVVSDKILGVVTFQCGHVYHKVCIPELACPLCFLENCKVYLSSITTSTTSTSTTTLPTSNFTMD